MNEFETFNNLDLCIAAEETSGKDTIAGVQEIKGLLRVYPKTKTARNKLLVEGCKINGRTVMPCDKNPYILKDDGSESPTTKLWISDIPLSCDDADIETALVRIGCTLRSKMMYEKMRNRDGKLTRFYTGRRFAFITLPEKHLSTELEIGGMKAKLYYREQPKQNKTNTVCSKCLQKGHWAGVCTSEVVCRECMQIGHKRGDPQCRGRAMNELNAMNVMMNGFDAAQTQSENEEDEHMERIATNNDEEENSDEGEKAEEWVDCEGGEKKEVKEGRRGRKAAPQNKNKAHKQLVAVCKQQTLPFTRARSLTPKRGRASTGDSPTNVAQSETPKKQARLSLADGGGVSEK